MPLDSTFSTPSVLDLSASTPPSLAQDRDLADSFALAEKSAATLRAYRSDAEVFDVWVPDAWD